MVSVIITCAGSGQRANFGFNKLLKDIGGTTVFEKSLSAFLIDDIDEIIITCGKDDRENFAASAKKLGASNRFAGRDHTQSGSTIDFSNASNHLYH